MVYYREKNTTGRNHTKRKDRTLRKLSYNYMNKRQKKKLGGGGNFTVKAISESPTTWGRRIWPQRKEMEGATSPS